MEWLNEPATWKENGNIFDIAAEPGTDMWREPGEGGIRSNVHFYYETRDGDFTAVVKVSGDYSGLYDQAGIMIRADDVRWMKCGIEFVHGVQQASVVMTRDWSDWSLLSVGDPEAVWFKVERQSAMIFVYLLDSVEYTLMRKAYFSDSKSVDVGVMAGAPKGKGFTATFEDFTIQAN